MPRTRPEIDRDAKVEEVLAAAERRLREGGWPALSVAGIARELGLAQNAVYWYFPTKDHLFVAALERMLRDIVARKRGTKRTVEGKILWFVDQLAEVEHVRAALRERAREAEVVAEFAEQLDDVWRRMLTGVLSSRLEEPELSSVVGVLHATIQGALLGIRDPAERRRVIGDAVARLAPAG
jgi:AcrR family transcriptional regulator